MASLGGGDGLRYDIINKLVGGCGVILLNKTRHGFTGGGGGGGAV